MRLRISHLFPPEFVGILSSTDRSQKMADVLYSGVCFFNVHKLLMLQIKLYYTEQSVTYLYYAKQNSSH